MEPINFDSEEYEPIVYDLSEIIDEMDEEEKEKYFIESSSKYFRYLYTTKKFESILDKLDNNYTIKEDEWLFLFKRFFAVTCKAIEENEKLSFLDKIIYMFSNIGIHMSKLDSRLYNECYKMIEYIKSINMNKDINSDLLYGLEQVGSKRDYKKLDILLKQHTTACNYRESKDLFYDNYKKNDGSNISYEERMAISSFNRHYNKEKELVKKYK